MSSKANPAAIGAFVLAASAIAVAALVVVGSGKFFVKTSRCVIFFESSLSGLDVGAPVEYRGVRVGQVAEILLQYNAQTREVLIPVYINLEENRFKHAGAQDERESITNHIERGLRAQLESQSLLTGKMKVMLVDEPETPPRLVGGDPDTIEIPAIPTLVENISQTIKKLPLAQIVSNLDISIKQVADMTASGELTNTVPRLNGALREIEDLGHHLNQELPGLLASARQNGDRLQQVQGNLDAILQEVRALVANQSPERQQLMTTLRSLEEAANSLRQLLDYLQVHPEALLSGKKEE